MTRGSHFGPPYRKPLDKTWRDVAEDAAEERGFGRTGHEADAIMLAVGRVVDHFVATVAATACPCPCIYCRRGDRTGCMNAKGTR